MRGRLASIAAFALLACAGASQAQPSEPDGSFSPLTDADMRRFDRGVTCTFTVNRRGADAALLLWRDDTLYARTRAGLQRCRLPSDRGPNPRTRLACAGRTLDLRVAPPADDAPSRAWLTVSHPRRITTVTGEWGCEA